jgi:hypothetical protein
MAKSIPTNTASDAAITARDAEYTGTPCTDVPGDGTRADPYLGMNRAGGNSPGIGIATGIVAQSAADLAANGERFQEWTLLDQAEAARVPQESGLIGHINDATTAGTPNDFTPATVPITHTTGADINNTANFLSATVAAADGAVLDVASGAVNNTGTTLTIGDLVWGQVPVA